MLALIRVGGSGKKKENEEEVKRNMRKKTKKDYISVKTKEKPVKGHVCQVLLYNFSAD